MKAPQIAFFTMLSCLAPLLPAQESVTTPRIANLSAELIENPANVQARADRGFAFAMVGEARLAIADFEKALEGDAKSRSIRYSYGWALFNLGMHDAALEQWQDSIKLHDKVPWWAPHTLALGYWTTGRKTEALQQFDAAVTNNPDKFGTWQSLQSYTDFWTWEEKQKIYQLFDAWNRAYKSGVE